MSKKNNKKMYASVEALQNIDYKDLQTLRKFLSSNLKIVPRRRSGLSASQQRKVSRAIKQARIAGLIAFTPN